MKQMEMNMSVVTIDNALCQKDGICVAACPLGLIRWNEDGFPQETDDAAQSCIGCGHCVASCPYKALVWRATAPDSLQPLAAPSDGLRLATERLFLGRRSTRVYRNQTVPREELEKLLRIVKYAPTGANRRPVHWTVLADGDRIRELAGHVADGLRHSVYFARIVKAWDSGRDSIFRGAPHVFIAHAPTDGFDPATSCIIAMTHLELAAHGVGLGACWAGVLMVAAQSNPKVTECLELPEGHRIYGAMMIGTPAFSYPRTVPRVDHPVRWV
jgi:nitroreductase/NAD-dependent dihydropyrimidine dehydrogenase PreA subunit